MDSQFRGTGVALVTPFKDDLSLDLEGLKRVVEFNIRGGVDYLVVLGTTGESTALDKEEKKQVIDKVIEVNNGRLPLVLGIGGNNTRVVVDELSSTDLSAFEAVLSVSPSYNRPTQEGIYQHFSAVAKASPKPVILYNVPARTGSNVLPETVIRLAGEFDQICGIKEAVGEMVQIMRLIDGCPDDFLIISGEDMTALPTVLAGGSGVISVIGQGLPKEFSKMVELGLAGKPKASYELHYKIAPAIDLIFEEGNPAGIKSMLNKLGLCGDAVRLPLVSVSDSLRSRIHNFMDSL